MKLFINAKRKQALFCAAAIPVFFCCAVWGAGSFLRLIMQLSLRAGIEKEALRPIDRVGAIKAPKLFIAGAKDQHTKLDESREIFAAASEPKELWVVEAAAHVDVHQIAEEEYERRILDFFEKRLR
jgi:fermentation-respiration switch protein FrsA (DUF1100 family)